MSTLEVSFQNHNVLHRPTGFSFLRRHRERFAWLAFLAYARKYWSSGGGWVDLEMIRQLPGWKGKSRHHAGDNIARYLQDFEDRGIRFVQVQQRSIGPYRLQIVPDEISFDIPRKETRKRLCIREVLEPIRRERLLKFARAYLMAEASFHEGYLLLDEAKRKRLQASAYDILLRLSESRSLRPDQRLVALLAASRVLDRLGRFQIATDALAKSSKLLRMVTDPTLRAKLFLARAWQHYRSGHDQDMQRDLGRATLELPYGVDKGVEGAIAEREALSLSRRGSYEQALSRFADAVDSYLSVGNYDQMQGCCFNLGNTLHRMDGAYYSEARKWLTLSVDISCLMNVGRNEALAETTLAKIELESGNIDQFRQWIDEAAKIVDTAHNRLGQSEVHVIRAFYYERTEQPEKVVEELVAARRIYSRLHGFDVRSRDKYLASKFPGRWLAVLVAMRKTAVH